MAKNLVIVESPAKAKTIEKFLGSEYKVMSSFGHIRDLHKKDFSIDVENGFKPLYEIPEDKEEQVKKLKAEASKADVVWLASDEDREGEAEKLSDEEVEASFGQPNPETVQLIRAALQHLPPDERAIITMFYYEEMSLKDIAYVTESIPTTVASKLSRTRKKLYKRLCSMVSPSE